MGKQPNRFVPIPDDPLRMQRIEESKTPVLVWDDGVDMAWDDNALVELEVSSE